MSCIERLSLRTVVRPMRTTFATALGAKNAATSVLVTVTLADGRPAVSPGAGSNRRGIGEVPTSR